MSAEFALLAQAHAACFNKSRGDLVAHAEIMAEVISEQWLSIGGFALIQDPDACAVLIAAYRKVTKYHNYTSASDREILPEIARQINLARSLVKYGVTGYCND